MILSSGFRAPNLDDVAKVFDSAPGKVVFPNEALKPEFSKNIELGLDKTFNDRLNFKFIIYQNHINNINRKIIGGIFGQNCTTQKLHLPKIAPPQNCIPKLQTKMANQNCILILHFKGCFRIQNPNLHKKSNSKISNFPNS